MDDEERKSQYFGQDCPVGMVQVEFVGCNPKDKRSDYGWKPVKGDVNIDLWVDGKRFNITLGSFYDGKGQRRGIHIITDCSVNFEQTSMNAASMFFKEETHD